MDDVASGSEISVRCGSAMGRAPLDVADVVDRAIGGLDGAPATLAIITVSGLDPLDGAGRVLADAGRLLRLRYPDCTVIGSCAHGVSVAGDAVELDQGLVVWVASWPGTAPRPFRIATVPAPLGGGALTGLPDLVGSDRLAVMLADPWSLAVDDAVAGMIGAHGVVPVVGGLVSGAQGRGAARLLLNGSVFDNGAVGVVLDAAAPVRAVVSQGCRPIGSAMTVTRAQGNVIEELAGARAVDRIREAIDSLDDAERALVVRGLHVGIARDDQALGDLAADYVIRGILSVDTASGSMTVGDTVPIGSVVRLHLRDADSATADLHSVIRAARGDGVVAGAYVVTCNGRGRAMFAAADHDVSVVSAGLGTAAVGGFFAAGEIGPVGGANHIHGFTAVILVVDAEVGDRPVEIARDAGRADEVSGLDDELRALLDP